VKPDASRSFAAADSAGPAARVRSGPRASPGSVDRPCAGTPCVPAPGSPHCSTAARGRSYCTTALRAGTAHTRTSARGDPRHPWPQQRASRPPLRAPKRLRSRCARALDETRPSVQYFARTVCSTRWGAAVRTTVRSSGPPRPCWFPGQRRSTAQLAERARTRRCPAQVRRHERADARTAHGRQPPPQACPRRRAGVAYDERTTAAVGKPCSRHQRRPRLVNARETVRNQHRSLLADPPSWVSSDERRWVSSGERRSRIPLPNRLRERGQRPFGTRLRLK